MNFIVSGIGTEVGKTIASAILCEILDAAYWKPVQSGAETDSDKGAIKSLVPGIKTYEESYVLQEPASPHYAAALENTTIDLERIKAPKHQGHLIIEGAGGLLVPLSLKFHYADWFKKMQWPIILVSRHYLGSINHTLLSVEYLKNHNIPLAGILFNGPENKSTETAISSFSKVPILGRINEADKLNADFVKAEAERLRSAVIKGLGLI